MKRRYAVYSALRKLSKSALGVNAYITAAENAKPNNGKYTKKPVKTQSVDSFLLL